MMVGALDLVDEFDPRAVPHGSVRRVAKRFATTPDGAPATYPVIVVAAPRDGPVATLVAGIHGDEYEGPAALWRVLERLTPATLVCGRVVVVPVAHGAAFAAGTRTSPVDGLNLARVFPGEAGGTATLRLAHDLFATVVRPADLLVDLHSGGARLAFLQVAGFYAADAAIDPGRARRSRALARAMTLPHLWQMPGRDGVLTYEAMRAGIAATGCEAGGRGGCLARDVDAYARGVLGVLAEEGMIERPADLPAPATPTGHLLGDFALAPVGGFLEPLVELGARVAAGTPLARIRGTDGVERALLRAEADGLVMAERHLRSIQAGEWATCTVREVAS